MAIACIPKSVLSSTACSENPAGLSTFLFAVPVDNVNITVDDARNQYGITAAAGPDAALQGYRIDFKAQTGQYTSEDNGIGKGWTGTATGRVELAGDVMAWTSRVLHNSDKYLYFIATGKKVENKNEYIVIGNENGEAEWAVAAGSGATRQDDHGQTFTVTCGYQLYPMTKFVGTIQQKDNDSPTPVQHEYVDLGLPSGTLWATTNIGATNPEDYGDYFAWGEMEPKENYEWTTYKFNPSEDGSTMIKYNSTDNLTTLEVEDDVAHVLWGSNWHMPTQAQMQELIDNCTWTWETVNGINGYTVSGNGNSIFLPAAGVRWDTTLTNVTRGYYWSSSLYTSDSRSASYLFFHSTGYEMFNSGRADGRNVRPVITP